jgi:ferredoxin--NADP+ reductase
MPGRGDQARYGARPRQLAAAQCEVRRELAEHHAEEGLAGRRLVHGCRQVSELAYGERIQQELPNDEFLGEMIREQLIYYPTVTREPFRNRGRITDLLTSGQLFSDTGLGPFDPAGDRFMLCGSPQMLVDLKQIFDERGLEEGNHGEAGDYVIEKAFAER